MINKNLIKFIMLLLFVSSCGYNPIFSNKNSNFSIYELSSSGNSKLNKIINSRLKVYKDSNSLKKFSIGLETSLNKKIASKDSKGNPKTFRLSIESKVSIKDNDGNIRKKSFSKTIDYNNKSNKSQLKKYENETSRNLAEKVSEEIIIYLQSI
tara:strand:- start:2314 stop:2772 length:459 start_codon:yes stop_codon:yes gene_type:complete